MKADRKKVELAMARSCMNVSDIIKKSGMPAPTVRSVVIGKNITPRTLGKFAKAIEVDPADIVKKEA